MIFKKDNELAAAIVAYVTGLRSARKRPLRRSEILAWFSGQDPELVSRTLDRLIAEKRLKLVEDGRPPQNSMASGTSKGVASSSDSDDTEPTR